MSAVIFSQPSKKLQSYLPAKVINLRVSKYMLTGSAFAFPLQFLWVMFLGTLISACSSKPMLDYDPQFKFDGIKSWSIDQAPNSGLTLDLQRIDAAVKASLDGRYEFRETSPDVSVAYRIEDEVRYDQPTVSIGFGVSSGNVALGSRTQAPMREKRVGKIRIDIIDATSKRMIWTALSGEVLTDHMSIEDRNRLIVREVEGMLGKFPPSR